MLMLHGRLRTDEIVHACGSAGDPTRALVSLYTTHKADHSEAREIQDATIQLVQHLYVLPTSSELSCIEEDSIDRRYHVRCFADTRITLTARQSGRSYRLPKVLQTSLQTT